MAKKVAARKKSIATKKKVTKTATKKTVAKKSTAKKVKPAAKKAKPAAKAKKRVAKKSTSKRKYGPIAAKEVAKEMALYKKGTAVSGKAEVPVESREQAIAIGLSKARAKGAKVPKKKK